MSKKPAKPISKTTAKGGIAAKRRAGRNKFQSAGIGKAISPAMTWQERQRVADYGDLANFWGLAGNLESFYDIKGRLEEAKAEPKRKKYLSKVMAYSEEGLRDDMADALQEGDASFFQAMARLIPLAKKGKLVSAPDAALIRLQHFWAACPNALLDPGLSPEEKTFLRNEQARLEKFFPVWPASVPELHQWVGLQGVECDQKTIREAAQRVGFPVRKAKLGAPKKKPAK